MSFEIGARVTTPEGIKTAVVGHTTEVIEKRNDKGEVIDRREVPLVIVSLDGEATGSYPADRLTPIADEEE